METAVTVKQTNQLSTEVSGAWGADEVESTDIRIPRILLMQQMSEMVAQEIAKPGELVDSTTSQVVCTKQEVLKIVPIYIFKDWVEQKEINGKYEYVQRMAYGPHNANLPREEVRNGEKFRNVIGINVLAMLEKDINDPSALPVMMTFRMTSLNAGKDISTLGLRAKSVNKPVAAFTIALGTELVKNEKGNYYVMKVKGVENTNNFNEVAPRLHGWYQTFKAGTAKVDEETLTDDTIRSGAGDVSSQF